MVIYGSCRINAGFISSAVLRATNSLGSPQSCKQGIGDSERGLNTQRALKSLYRFLEGFRVFGFLPGFLTAYIAEIECRVSIIGIAILV